MQAFVFSHIGVWLSIWSDLFTPQIYIYMFETAISPPDPAEPGFYEL